MHEKNMEEGCDEYLPRGCSIPRIRRGIPSKGLDALCFSEKVTVKLPNVLTLRQQSRGRGAASQRWRCAVGECQLNVITGCFSAVHHRLSWAALTRSAQIDNVPYITDRHGRKHRVRQNCGKLPICGKLCQASEFDFFFPLTKWTVKEKRCHIFFHKVINRQSCMKNCQNIIFTDLPSGLYYLSFKGVENRAKSRSAADGNLIVTLAFGQIQSECHKRATVQRKGSMTRLTTPQTTTSSSDSPPPRHTVDIYWKAVFNEQQCLVQVFVPLHQPHAASNIILNRYFRLKLHFILLRGI